jgi:threonine synthase
VGRDDDRDESGELLLYPGRWLREGRSGYRFDAIDRTEFVRYLSTRDPAAAPAAFSFEEVLLGGLAEDGGLYVPERLPAFDLAAHCGLRYAELAARIVGLYAGEAFSAAELRAMAQEAYATFRHAAVAPLVQLDERLWLLELFHGPTLAFKDLALQLVGPMLDAVLKRRGRRATIIGATSGDTGSAALAACQGRAALDVFILYPQGRISEVQRRQMTTTQADNARAIAIEGSFDDCQDIVKALFADPALRHDFGLAAVNSINWARIAAQVVYYLAAGLALGAPRRSISFSVPTGNFGNVYAGHVARQLGLPVGRLVIGTNQNDILARYLDLGEMAIKPVEPSLSPSMDIQVSSNFERLLFELKGKSGAGVAAAMREFRATGRLPRDDQAWQAARRLFSAHRVDDEATVRTIGRVYARTARLIDPHSAVAVAAAEGELARGGAEPIVALATAHPAKFPDAVARATGIRPPLPDPLADLFERKERLTVLPNDVSAVASFIRAHARRAREAA